MLKKRTISPPPPPPSPYHIYMNQIYRWEHTYTKIYNYIEFLSCYTLISSKKKRTLPTSKQTPKKDKRKKGKAKDDDTTNTVTNLSLRTSSINGARKQSK